MLKGTFEKILIIPEDDLPLLENLKKQRGWKEKNLSGILKYFANKESIFPPLSDDEIIEEVKEIRYELQKNRSNRGR